MTFSAVGSIIQSQATTFTLAPHTVGNFVLIEITGNSTASQPSSISSSNATWVKLGTAVTTVGGSPFNPSTAQIFIGTVTSTSSATATISWTGTTPTLIQNNGQEFSSSVGASSVTLDVQGSLNVTVGQSAWPNLTPGHGAGELYFGYALNSGAATAGSTSGYNYSNIDLNGNGSAYNVSCPNSSTGPTWGDTGQVFGTMVLVYEASGAAAAGKLQPWATVPVPRRRLARAVVQKITGQPPPAAPNREPPPPPRARPPRRAIVLSVIGRPPPATPNKEPPPGPWPGPPRRAFIQRVTGSFPPATALGTANREPFQPSRARPPQRAVTRSVTGASPAAVTRAFRQPPALPAARRPARAVVLSVQPARVAAVVPAAAVVPSGVLDRHPGYLKKRILFGI